MADLPSRPIGRPLHRSDPPELKVPLHQGEGNRPNAAFIKSRRVDQRRRSLGAFGNVQWEDPTNPGQPVPPPRPHPKLIERAQAAATAARAANAPESLAPPPIIPTVDPVIPTRPAFVPEITPPPNAVDPQERLRLHRERQQQQQLPTNEPVIPPKPLINGAASKSEEIIRPPNTVNTSTQPEYERLDLPSGCIPYSFSNLNFRLFDPFDLAKLHRARVEQSDTLMIDVIDGTIDQDARDLTVGDFNFLMYRLRLDSYLSSPFKINYTSRYGNACEITLSNSKLEILPLKITQNEYNFYKMQGIVCPTMRAWELAKVNQLDTEQEFLWQRAQYLSIPLNDDPKQDVYKEKIELLQAGGVAIMEKIRDYAEKIAHGVKETITVTDDKFTPAPAIEHLRKTSVELREAAEVFSTTGMQVLELITRANDLSEEADLIEATIKDNKVYIPKSQEVQLNIQLLSFFPGI
jgi:hypothetical protein